MSITVTSLFVHTVDRNRDAVNDSEAHTLLYVSPRDSLVVRRRQIGRM